MCRLNYGAAGMLLRSPHGTAAAIGEKPETKPVALRFGGRTQTQASHRLPGQPPALAQAIGFAPWQSLDFQGRPAWRYSICLPVELNCDGTATC